jgi:hypothetical protein
LCVYILKKVIFVHKKGDFLLHLRSLLFKFATFFFFFFFFFFKRIKGIQIYIYIIVQNKIHTHVYINHVENLNMLGNTVRMVFESSLYVDKESE